MIYRPSQPLSGTFYDVLAGVLIIALLIVVAVTFRSYGFTIDEDNGYLRALAITNFLTSLGSISAGISQIDDLNVYGAMPDVIALTLQHLFPALRFDSRHLVSALFGVLGVYSTYRFGANFVAKSVGFFGALFLACNPMWFGYMFINAKDIPFAALLIASSCYCFSAISGRYTSRWIWLKVAICVGLFATTKLTGLVLLVFIVAVMVSAQVLQQRDPVKVDRPMLLRMLATALAALAGCLLCFVFFWPQFYFFKFTDIVSVIQTFTNYTVWMGMVQIHGEFLPPTRFRATTCRYISRFRCRCSC